MSLYNFIQRQYSAINQGGWLVFWNKVHRAILELFSLPIVLVFFFAMRLLRPWLLIRMNLLTSDRIGHFAANTELYLCECEAGINVPKQRYLDLCYHHDGQFTNKQLAIMWGRHLRIWPAWFLGPVSRLNKLFPGGSVYEVGNNTQGDRDVHNLLDRFPPHLQFTAEEEVRGEAGLRMMGIPAGTPFVCLIVRDSAYLDAHQSKDWSYHNYRDNDIQNYVLAAEELADRGYFVVRMGVKVRDAIKSDHSRVIDYATNGMRSDFMDICLGAKCAFCISTSTGFDALPLIFRRPIVFVNLVPLGYLWTFRSNIIGITKHHITVQGNRELTLKEIFTHDVGFSLRTSDYETNGIRLIENTPEEIRDVVVEMAERLNGTWQPGPDDDALQRRFWEIYPVDARDPYQDRPLHGKVRAHYGAQFLRDNREFLE